MALGRAGWPERASCFGHLVGIPPTLSSLARGSLFGILWGPLVGHSVHVSLGGDPTAAWKDYVSLLTREHFGIPRNSWRKWARLPLLRPEAG